MARSVSRWPPCAAGSMSQPRPPDHSTFPAQQSPWIRLGGSAGPASEPIRSTTSSTSRASSGRSAPASTARIRNGSSLRCAYHCGQSAASGVLSSGRLAMNPGHGAPKPSAPAACSRARSVPNWKAASGVAGPGGIIEMTSASGPTASTSGTGTACGLGQPAQAVRLGRERGRHLPGRARRDRAGVLTGGRDGLGEGAAPAGQREHEVLVAMLRADDPRLADDQAGQLPDPVGQGGGTAHAGSPGRPSSWASRAAMTGAAAPSRSST